MFKFPSYVQPDTITCGPTCLWIVSSYYGKYFDLEDFIKNIDTEENGVNLLKLSLTAEKIGFRSYGAKMNFEQMTRPTNLPLIALWNFNHYIVVYKIRKNSVYVSDPSCGLIKYSKADFVSGWIGDANDSGVVLLLEPTNEFYKTKTSTNIKIWKNSIFKFLLKHIAPYKKSYFVILTTLIIGSLLQLIFPFLTQTIVDVGIKNKDITLVYLILFAQLMLFFPRIILDLVREWVLNKVSSKISISLTNDFFSKLMRLPISFFDKKMTGDIIQRIFDNQRIEQFLNGNSLRTLFSTFSLIILSGVLAWYNIVIFLVFTIGTLFYVYWIIHYLKRREELDHKLFKLSSQNQGKVLELINGMQELKLNQAETKKRWEWQEIQGKLFRLNLDALSINQIQNTGSSLINELKNILITFYAAKLVIESHITLGVMLSISYITGQLNAPVLDLVTFMQEWQFAKISILRLTYIHDKTEEEVKTQSAIMPNGSILFKNVYFKYNDSKQILNDLTVIIPHKKTVALVGLSGSGKTTLIKLLLRFYNPDKGEIIIGNTNLNSLSPVEWRKKCGVVMQDGYIFSDTIANNIAMGEDTINIEKLNYAIQMANISEFSAKLNDGINTNIGPEGVSLSSGQKQRILIARVIYKNPEYIFLDEATNSLDSVNENAIQENLKQFCKNKTVLVVAHRLSTVRDADKIIVIDNSKIVEQGTHHELINNKGSYYKLVKNQLELEG